MSRWAALTHSSAFIVIYRPSGRLPYTMYDSDFTARRPTIEDMSLSDHGGITYQHYTGTPLWPFGHGLSYSNFDIYFVGDSLQRTSKKEDLASVVFNVLVNNTGSVRSDVTVLAYLTLVDTTDAHGLPLRELFAFCRIRALAPSGSAECVLGMDPAVASHNGLVREGSYAVSIELGDGTSVAGSMVVDSR